MLLEQVLIQIIQLLGNVLGAVLPDELPPDQRITVELALPVLHASLKYPAKHFAGQSDTMLDDVSVDELLEMVDIISTKYGIDLS